LPKIFAQNKFVLLLLMALLIFGGCELPTTVNGPTRTASTKASPTFTSKPENPAITATSLPCNSVTETPTTELEKVAETWFLSSISEIPARSQYKFNDVRETWRTVCSAYQRLLLSTDRIAYNPTEISLRLITESAQNQSLLLDNVIMIATSSKELLAGVNQTHPANYFRNIATVVVRYPYTNVQFESRVDYVLQNEIWQIRWSGMRWRCINSNDSKWNTIEKIDCP
jgi:hypothetical protein